MNFIPSDNTLKRHCLTEIRNIQRANFAAMLYAAQPVPVPEHHSMTSNYVILPLIGFLIVIMLFFV